MTTREREQIVDDRARRVASALGSLAPEVAVMVVASALIRRRPFEVVHIRVERTGNVEDIILSLDSASEADSEALKALA